MERQHVKSILETGGRTFRCRICRHEQEISYEEIENLKKPLPIVPERYNVGGYVSIPCERCGANYMECTGGVFSFAELGDVSIDSLDRIGLCKRKS